MCAHTTPASQWFIRAGAPACRCPRGGHRAAPLRHPADTGYTAPPMPRLLVSCGEPSGDLYAAELVRHLRARRARPRGLRPGRRPPARPRARGCSPTCATSRWSGSARWSRTSRRFRRDLPRASWPRSDRQPPDVAVLVDYPDFNLRLARALHRRGIPVVYYVSPQVWAWRRGRLRAIRETSRTCSSSSPSRRRSTRTRACR